MSTEDAALLLQGMKTWKTVKSQLMPCSACKHCTDAVPYEPCRWRLKVLACQETDSVDVHELGDHHSRARAPLKAGITPCQRNFITELARENMMPLRILHTLGRKFDLRPSALPSQRKVQNIVYHFRRTRLGGNDKRKLIVEAVRAAAFSGREGDHDAFTFTNEYDAPDIPNVGNGSDAKPFLVGMTTKALLCNAARDPATSCRIWTQRQVEQRWVSGAPALVALRRVYARVNGSEMQVKYVLGDADKAQHKAFRGVFTDCNFQYLMCFYHVVAKLREKTRGMSSVLSQLVYRGIYDLHFARSEEEFDVEKVMLKQWAEHPNLSAFTTYVKSQWLYGNFANWQAFLSPSGFATTNNPVEQFNRALKRDYTHHRQLKMGMLITQLLACCGNRSMALSRFSLVPTCPVTLQTRTRGLRRHGLLIENAVTRSSIDFILGDADSELVHVRAVPPMRLFVPELNRAREDITISAQFGVHYARMEVEGQPRTGWPVYLRTAYCPC